MSKNSKDLKKLLELERISRSKPNRLLRLHGFCDKEIVELIVYKGFTSCTTHPTEYDLCSSPLPEKTILESADLLQGPIDNSKEVTLKQGSDIDFFLIHENWN